MKFSNDYENTLDSDRKKIQLEMSHLGVSTHPGRHQLGELRSAISRGGKTIELGWFGKGKGSVAQGNLNPEVHSKEEREAMRELAKINKVQLSTHASPNMGYLSGLGEGGFSKQNQQATKEELDRAIDFAADVAEGGPVVLHVGEFQRPVFEAEKRFGSEAEYFEAMENEKQIGIMQIVDKETGKVSAIPRSATVSQIKPGYENAEIKEYVEVPIYKLIEEKEKTVGLEKAPVEVYKELIRKDLNNLDIDKQNIGRQVNILNEKITNLKNVAEGVSKGNPQAIAVAKRALERERWYGVGMSNEEIQENINQLAALQEEERLQLVRKSNSIEKELSSKGHQIENMSSVYEYGIEQSSEAIADEALRAYKIEKEKGLKQPLWLALENWDAGTYGNHPRELRELILDSRSKMVDKLQGQGMNKSQASKVAEDHIKATFDIGHANFWRKYYKGDKNLSTEQNETRFKKWLIDEVKELQKDNIIGHVHLSDNFGWHDEHLTPGAGNAPIEEFVEEIAKGKEWKGRMIVEPGGQPEGQVHTAFTDTWRQLNTPIYRIDSAPQTWSDIQGSYVNQVANPTTHIVGEYVPFRDWSSWSSEIPLE